MNLPLSAIEPPVRLPDDWRNALLEADSVADLVGLILQLAEGQPGVRRSRILWELDPQGVPASEPPTDEALRLADDAMLAGSIVDNGRGLVAIPLPASTAVLLVELAPGTGSRALARELAAPLAAADRRLRNRLRLTELEREVLHLERAEQVQRALFAISELAGSDREMPEVLRGIHGIVGSLMYAENFFIVLRDPSHDTVRFLYFVDVEDEPPFGELPLDELRQSVTWYLLRSGVALRGNEERLARQVDGPLRMVGSDCHDWLGVPMLRNGEALGAIVVQSYRSDQGFSEDDQTLLGFVADHVLTTLERKRSTELLEHSVKLRTQELAQANCDLQLEVAERQRAERLQSALFQIAQLATDDIGEEAFYLRVHDIVGQLLNADNFFIGLLSADGARLEFPYYVDSHGNNGPMHRPLSRGLSEYVLRTRQPLLATGGEMRALEARGEIEYHPGRGRRSKFWLGIPLFLGDDVIGLVVVQSYDPSIGYGQNDRELLEFVASQIASSLHRRRSAQVLQHAYAQLEERVAERTLELRREITERERVQDQLQHEVMHDALTGLPNRGQLHARIARVLGRLQLEPQRRCALLYLDVDRFKVVNDSLGHLAGDDLLREVARRLQACVRKPDLVARLSGDEFAILIEDASIDASGRPTAAIAVAERVLELLSRPMPVGGRALEPSASIGIAVGDARYSEVDDLVRDADTALYRAKALGRKRWQLFDESLQRTAIDVLEMEGELREALRLDQLEPYFQPIVRLRDGKVVGHEALMRWNHPRRGVLAPGDFLAVAEESGLIDAMDWRLFKRSAAWAAQMPPGTYLSINVSPRHLRREDFDQRMLELLGRTGMDPKHLVIEVTEGSLLDDPDNARMILTRLQSHGVGTALDDFGTGYSSLSYLHAFPLRVLKIDRTFLASLGQQGHSAAVISAVIALAGALGLDVVAEGIETEEQRQALLELGCEFGQGYLFGKPMPATASAP